MYEIDSLLTNLSGDGDDDKTKPKGPQRVLNFRMLDPNSTTRQSALIAIAASRPLRIAP